MENNNSSNFQSVFLGIISFVSSVVAIFKMFYIFAIISVITGFVALKHDESKPIAIVSLIIVVISFVLKVLGVLTQNGVLPQWLINGVI